jgi:hypothetical protein
MIDLPDHRDRALIMQDVLGGNGLCSDPRVGEGDVLWDLLVEVMTDHEHLRWTEKRGSARDRRERRIEELRSD